MTRENIGDLIAFLAVAQEPSFTRAAAKIGVPQSALVNALSYRDNFRAVQEN